MNIEIVIDEEIFNDFDVLRNWVLFITWILMGYKKYLAC